MIALLEILPELNEAQIEFAILKNCLGVCKINHLLRSLPPIPSLSIQIFDQHQRVCLERIVSRPLTDLQWQLALLPTIKGGLGLRCASNTQLPAYLASRIATWHNVAAITGPLLNIRESQDLKNATDKFLEQVPEFDLEEHWGVERGLQKRFSSYIIKQQVGSFFEQSDSLTRANTLSFTLPHATDYLFAKPSRNLGLKFTNSEFRITLCRQLRVQIFDKTLTCIACNTSLMDSFGDHALSCSSSRDRIARHNDTRDLVFHACRSAGLSPVLEAKGLSATSRRRPGDVFIPNWKHGSPAAVDVTLTCPLQSTVINKAAEEVGYACKLAEERKFAASAELCQQSGLDFIPLALETSGGFGSCATSFLTVLAERCADNNMRDRVIEKRQLFQRINVAVHRSNANMILSRIPIREPEPLNLRFSWEKPLPTTSKRLRDEVSEEGPLAKTPLCFVEELQDNNASFNFPQVGQDHSSVSPQPSANTLVQSSHPSGNTARGNPSSGAALTITAASSLSPAGHSQVSVALSASTHPSSNPLAASKRVTPVRYSQEDPNINGNVSHSTMQPFSLKHSSLISNNVSQLSGIVASSVSAGYPLYLAPPSQFSPSSAAGGANNNSAAGAILLKDSHSPSEAHDLLCVNGSGLS